MTSAPATYTAAMSGARNAVTLPIRRMPPRITPPTTAAVTRPVTHAGTANVDWSVSATVLACTAFPVRNAVKPSITAKNTARGFHAGPRPRSM